MVTIFNFDVPNGYIGGTVGGVLVLFLIWYLFRSQGGRLDEEKQEERETERLEIDEKIVEATQSDEKKQCIVLDKLFSEIMLILRKSGNNTLADSVLSMRTQISKILSKELNEKMSVKKALQTFTNVHALINEFLAKLPNDDQQINMLVEEIKRHQQDYYKDLIKELEMDEIKKKQLQRLWTEVLDEESGQGKLQAA